MGQFIVQLFKSTQVKLSTLKKCVMCFAITSLHLKVCEKTHPNYFIVRNIKVPNEMCISTLTVVENIQKCAVSNKNIRF